MKCPRCQHENLSHANFCLKCGTPLNGADLTARPYTDLKDENDGLRRSLIEALEQQTATSEILRVIASSPATALQPVMNVLAENAARLCASYDAEIFRLDGDVLRLVALHGPLAIPLGFVVSAIRGTITGRTVLDRQTVQVADVQAEAERCC